MHNRTDGGVEARLKGMSPDLAPIILNVAHNAPLVGGLESSIRQIEDVFEKRLKKTKRDIHLTWGIAVFIFPLIISLMNLFL